MHQPIKIRPIFIEWTLLTILCSVQLVSSDLSIIDNATNQVVFQTASDFIRTTECGTLYTKEPANLIISNPFYTCDEPITGPPVSNFKWILLKLQLIFVEQIDTYFGTNLKTGFEPPSWVIIITAEEDGACDLQRKLINAEKAGYSAVLLATSDKLKNIQRRLDQTVLDLHLINPWDIKLLSKYDYNSNGSVFRIANPTRENTPTCKVFYNDTWLGIKQKAFSNGVNRFLTWIGYWSFVMYIQIYWDQLVKISGFVIITLFMVVPWIYLFTLKKEPEPIYSEPDPPPSFYFRHFEFPSEDEYEYQPPPPQDDTKIRKKHLRRLGLPLDKKPSSKQINDAYKLMARKEHPDKNPNRNETSQTEIMQQVNEARNYLLDKYCTDPNRHGG